MQKIITIITDITISSVIFLLLVIFYDINLKQDYLTLLLGGNILFTLGFYLQNLYQNIFTSIFITTVKIIQSWLIIAGIIFAIIFTLNFTEIGRKMIISWLFLTPVVLIISRYILQKIIKRAKIAILVLGDNYTWTKYELERLNKQNIELIQITDITKINNGDRVILNANNIDVASLNIYAKYLSISHFMEKYLRKCHIENISFLDALQPYSKIQKLFKCIIDYGIVLFITIFFIPIFIISGIVIKMQSRGKIIFTQHRIGVNNKKFTIYKFRSMYENSHFDPYTQKEDKRIFPYGNIMRLTRIDELPQIINILKRDMSLIGPRAEWDILSEKYQQEIEYYNLRSLIKPGLTGWAQINYPYGANVEDTKQKLMYDLYYIKHWSLALELETIVKTVFVVFGKKGL